MHELWKWCFFDRRLRLSQNFAICSWFQGAFVSGTGKLSDWQDFYRIHREVLKTSPALHYAKHFGQWLRESSYQVGSSGSMLLCCCMVDVSWSRAFSQRSLFAEVTIAFSALLCGGLCSWDGPKLWENIVIAGIALAAAWLVHFEAAEDVCFEVSVWFSSHHAVVHTVECICSHSFVYVYVRMCGVHASHSQRNRQAEQRNFAPNVVAELFLMLAAGGTAALSVHSGFEGSQASYTKDHQRVSWKFGLCNIPIDAQVFKTIIAKQYLML